MNRRGFTLVEVAVTLVVLGVASVLVVHALSTVQAASLTARRAGMLAAVLENNAEWLRAHPHTIRDGQPCPRFDPNEAPGLEGYTCTLRAAPGPRLTAYRVEFRDPEGRLAAAVVLRLP
ncbi:type II secretion system protein [Marinithermus hydrothermalis]|uniref:General secretion pathway protein I n=1 Tax=Marinithermus hydrothermalis (strain DSM 14884 / JCM 11576 / T1) TaxID=869210 RepID=F2NLT4_MARHT|nr:prepilin-type N-terminal cleavage/methylation domain-containing protein [Marinithermus hydrothermalis]AEB10914.1 general secretion pathway protein I [Marinithermus hydrothermalis DSM 14884]